jgi:hypothetical protein
MLMLSNLSTDWGKLTAERHSIALNRQSISIKATFNNTEQLLALSFLPFAFNKDSVSFYSYPYT